MIVSVVQMKYKCYLSSYECELNVGQGNLESLCGGDKM